MPVNWKDPKAFERLLAAMVAAQEMKLDYRKIASMYGEGISLPPFSFFFPSYPLPQLTIHIEGATYDAIEGRFRIIKREAAKLLSEVESGSRPPAPPRGSSASTTNAKKSSFTSEINDDTSTNVTPKKSRKPRSTNTTPRAKKADKVLAGRVAKNGRESPVKRDGNVMRGIKEEMASSGSSIYEDAGMEVGVEGLDLDAGFDFGGLGEMEV
ncbi:MAG: hypothetical protein Q9219_000607 [cf. Caloplaca sp. 3 TL-2023]